MVIVLDVETISIEYNAISDIAWGIINRNKLKQTKCYIPQETLSKQAEGEFSAPKLSATMAEVERGNAKIKPWRDICKELAHDIEQAKYVYAYNATFDRQAIIRTSKMLAMSEIADYFSQTSIYDKWRDLWAWAANTILFKKSFIDFCESNGLTTPKGYCSTSAETCLKYLRRDLDYVEQHTALADIKDEFDIYLAIKKEIKAEYQEICLDEQEQNFKGKPFFTIDRLKQAILN